MTNRLGPFVSLILVIVAGVCMAQQPIRVRTHLVNVSFTARDTHGALVDNLTQDDIAVSEDTIPQNVSYFAKSVDVPLTLGLIVDFSGSQEKETKQHQKDLEVFLKEVLGPKDRAFLVCFGNHVRLISDFTNSSKELIDRFKTYNPNKHPDRAEKLSELGPPEDRVLGTAFYDSIYYSVEEKLANETGRRALLVFSDGEDNSSSHDMMSTIESAQTADVLLFTIRYTEDEHGKLSARNNYGIRVMERLAKETGGAQFDAKALDPHEYFKQIGEELRTSYQIGYYPTNAANDDTFRKIVVKSKLPGIKIRTKTGYYSR